MSSLLVFNKVYRREIQSVMLVFSTDSANYCPSNLLSGYLYPLPCVNKYTVPYCIYVYGTMCKRGGGVWGGGVIGGRGPQTDKTPAVKSLYTSIFHGKIPTFGIAFCQSNLSTSVSTYPLPGTSWCPFSVRPRAA
jgi:hypothetical protein